MPLQYIHGVNCTRERDGDMYRMLVYAVNFIVFFAKVSVWG